MQQAMGSVLGGSTRDLNRGSRSSTRALSPRAAPYSLGTPLALRGAPNTASRPARTPTAWCSSQRTSSPAWMSTTPTTRVCCSRDSVSVAATAAPARVLWGRLPVQQQQSQQPQQQQRHPGRRDARRGGKVLPLPAAVPESASAAEADMEVPFTSGSGITVTVRNIRTSDELRQVATLRADAYYAENRSRFVGSLKKKFVEQEVESLQQRTTIMSRHGKPYSECLVALESSSGAVLACIDMRLPAALNGTHPHGVPQDDPTGCYLLNVVVREDVRGQGLGRGIMRVAMARSVRLWGAGQLYTHVEADNEVAFRLYHSCGFEHHSADSKYEASSKLGQTVLLQAPAEAAPAAL